jgi:hypothetical protein
MKNYSGSRRKSLLSNNVFIYLTNLVFFTGTIIVKYTQYILD